MKKIIYSDVPRPYDRDATRYAAIGIFLLICSAVACVAVLAGI